MGKTIKLKNPVQQGTGEPIRELVFIDRPLKGKDLRGVDFAQLSNADTLMKLAGRLTNQPPSVIEELEIQDLMDCLEVVKGFLSAAPSLPTGSSVSE